MNHLHFDPIYLNYCLKSSSSTKSLTFLHYQRSSYHHELHLPQTRL